MGHRVDLNEDVVSTTPNQTDTLGVTCLRLGPHKVRRHPSYDDEEGWVGVLQMQD